MPARGRDGGISAAATGSGKRAGDGYNRKVKQTLIVCILLAVVSLGGCRKNIQTDEAVRQGILSYLSQNKNLSLNAMDIEVKQVTFRGQEADAVVVFKPKGGDPSSGMSMSYTLERQNSGWVVKKKADTGPHGAAAAKALSTPPAAAPGSQIPMPTPSGAMPPGHPPMSAEPKK
jgi:hypothetical protein